MCYCTEHSVSSESPFKTGFKMISNIKIFIYIIRYVNNIKNYKYLLPVLPLLVDNKCSYQTLVTQRS